MQLQHFRIVVASKSNYPDIGLREKMQEVSCHLNGKNHQKSGFPAKIIKDFHKPTLGKHWKTIVQCHFSSCQCPSKTLTTLSSFGRRGFVASRCCLGHGRWDHVDFGGRDGVHTTGRAQLSLWLGQSGKMHLLGQPFWYFSCHRCQLAASRHFWEDESYWNGSKTCE